MVENPATCPICGKPSIEPVRPFCGERCAAIDLGRWFSETYRVPSEERVAGDDDDARAG